ncbi:hypothetical protein BU17DRAFT_85956 [Hysterangium stoloniferum]|nr:hypothetical protein BU17DRAFT_85956 [Hysterangium stoloniferum]
MIPTTRYNSLPNVQEAHELSLDFIPARNQLLSIIDRFGLNNEFGVRLIHKHFDLMDGEVMVFRHVMVKDVCEAVVMGPLPIGEAGVIEGKNFLIDINSRALVPYEFTTNGGCDPSKYPDLVHALLEADVESDALHVFGLIAKPKQLTEAYTEFELPALKSTIMVPARMIPVDVNDGEVEISTNWIGGDPKPEPVDGCTITRSNKHHGLNCRATRNSHQSRPLGGFESPELEAVVKHVIAVM